MSFMGQQAAETPALSLEETLALLDAFGGGGGDSPLSCTESSSQSGGCSSPSTSLDDLDELLAEVATPPSVWSDSDDAGLSSPLPSLVVGGGDGVGPSHSDSVASLQQRPKRKAAAAAPPTALETDEEEEEEEEEEDAQPPAAAAAKAPRKRRPRKQPKTEILRLRDEVEELQMRLLQLQKSSASGWNSDGAMVETSTKNRSVVVESPRGGASWLDIAVDQFKALQRAEELNEKLKAEVARQTRFGEAIKTQFTKKIAQQGPTFVHELEPAKPTTIVVRERLLDRSEGDTDADELYKSVQKMHIETDRLRREIAAESDVSSVFNSSKMKADKHGPVFEFKTSTPIDHPDFHRVGFSMWHRATTLGEDHMPREGAGRPPPVNHGIHGTNELHQRPVAMKMASRSGAGDVLVNGVVVMCKLDTAKRSVFTFASTLAIGGSSAFVLREHGWMIFAPHDSDATKSVFQVFYHLESEVRTADALTDSDKTLRQQAITALSDNIKFFLTDVQHMFGESTDFFDLTRFPVSCPLHKVYIE